MFDPYKIPGSRSLHERKMATWALLIGETYSSAVHAETRRRPHRGMLPDVDFSRAVPDHSRPSLVRRIIRLIRPGAKNRAGSGVPSGRRTRLSAKSPQVPILREAGPMARVIPGRRSPMSYAPGIFPAPRERKTDL